METRRTITLQAVVTLLILLGIAGSVAAYAPATEPVPPVQSPMGIAGGGGPGPVLPLLQYQGRLTNPSTGQPVADGTYAMTFNLYTDSSGSAVWTETKNVSVAGGLFSALIGDVTSLPQSLLNGQELWLGIKVGADAETTPRQTIFPVAYAMSLRPGAVISGSVSGAPILQVTNAGNGYGVRGDSSGGTGVYGYSSATSGTAYGVYGETNNPWGYGGYFTNTRGTGVFGGHSDPSSTSPGVYGRNIGSGAGVLGDSYSSSSAIIGRNYGGGYGGQFSSTSGQAIYASGDVTVTGDLNVQGNLNSAAARFISIEPYGTFLEGGATFSTGYGPYAGMQLPDTGTPDFSFGFTIPPNYIPGVTMVLRLIWHTSGTSCGIELRPNFTSFARAGSAHIVGATADAGLLALGGTTLNAPATSNQSNAKDYLIFSPDGSTNLQPGDSVILGLFRSSAAGTDTCTSNLVIQGIRIEY